MTSPCATTYIYKNDFYEQNVKNKNRSTFGNRNYTRPMSV